MSLNSHTILLFKNRISRFEQKLAKIAKTDMTPEYPQDALHGITLAMILEQLVAHMGWEELGRVIPVRCFTLDPSIKSSLTFLRKTPWARAKVESLYLVCRDEFGPATSS